MLDPGPSEEQQAIADALTRLGAALPRDNKTFPLGAWRQLAGLGVLGIGAADGGGATAVVAVMEALGATGFPGPLVATYFALQVVDDDTIEAVATGHDLVSMATGRYFPWGNDATWLLTAEGGEMVLARRNADGPSGTSLSGEPWTQPSGTVLARYAVPHQAVVHADLALAGYLCGAAAACLSQTATHARQRRQFGRSLGEFQAVSHALARSEAATSSALGLVRQCAWEWDQGGGSPNRVALARTAASTSAVEAVLSCHQVFGAMGFSQETGLWRLSTKVRELSLSWLPAPAARAAVEEGRRLAAEGARWRGSGS